MKTISRARERAGRTEQVVSFSSQRTVSPMRRATVASSRRETSFGFLFPNPQSKTLGGAILARSKKAEGTIIANLIIFVAVMAMAATTVFVFKASIDDSANQATAQGDRTASVMKTDFSISAASYSSGTVYVYVKNTGSEQFDPDDLDIYVDDIRMPRDPSNRTVTVTSDTDTINTGVWDQKEEVEFNVFITYAIPETHSVRIAAPNGVSADSEFSS